MKRYPLYIQLLKYIRNLAFFLLSISVLLTVVLKFLPPPFTPLMLIRQWENRAFDKDYTIKFNWVPIDKVSPKVITAVIVSEDPKFKEHWGFDFAAIKKAIDYNREHRDTIGASTITQQTAKNLFLWPSRTWPRKALEACFTLLIELIWSKERTMEVYLNIIETGKGLFGIEAASQEYFHKPAIEITDEEAAMFAAILPCPRKWHPGDPDIRVIRRFRWILWHMEDRGEIIFE